MKEYTFEIPSTCVEVVIVKAKSAKEAAQKLIDGEHEDSHIPESEYNITMDIECVLERLIKGD